jgi:hypothetical protein
MFKDVKDLKAFLEAKAAGLERYGYQLQPHVVVLTNDDFSGPYVCYACIHSTIYYEAATLIEAVDIVLKSTFVLGLQYPPPAHSSWAFLQKAVYQLSSRFDRVPSKVYELMSDIK